MPRLGIILGCLNVSPAYHGAMPISLPNLFRGIILLALAAHVFYMYSTARTIGETVGLTPATVMIASLFALIMLIPFIWAVALPEFPEMYLRHVRATRWFEQGRCPDCGYPTTGSRTDRCPECGVALASPKPYAVSWHTVRLFIIINALAWLIGCASAECWALVDEHRFRAEAARHIASNNEQTYERSRWWPNHSNALLYTQDQEIHTDKKTLLP